jgi:hypothetical protein
MELDKTLAKVKKLKKQNLQEGAIGNAVGQMANTAVAAQKNLL